MHQDAFCGATSAMAVTVADMSQLRASAWYRPDQPRMHCRAVSECCTELAASVIWAAQSAARPSVSSHPKDVTAAEHLLLSTASGQPSFAG